MHQVPKDILDRAKNNIRLNLDAEDEMACAICLHPVAMYVDDEGGLGSRINKSSQPDGHVEI